MIKNITNFLIILSTLLLTSGCTAIYKSCLFGGCYGPFEIEIKTEHGEHIEDVIVVLAHITADSFEGSTHTYKEYAIGNTDEPIHFPRGYIYRNAGDSLSLHMGIYHPDYETLDLYASFLNKSGDINLGAKTIIHSQDLLDRSNKATTSALRKKGYSEVEINKKLEGKRVQMPGINPSYFAYLTTLGRNDLVEKYLPTRLKKVADYKGYTASKTASFEEEVRENIKKKAERL